MQQLDWDATINSIRESLPQNQFQRWFTPLRLIRSDSHSVVLGVPSRFHEDWVKSRYSREIKQAIQKHCGTDLQLEFEILVVQEENIEASRAPVPTLPTLSTPTPRPTLRIVDPSPTAPQEPLAPARPVEPPHLPAFTHPIVELEFNHVAYQCVGMFAEGRNTQINPLILLGGVGMGKTHLLAEIGRRAYNRNPKLRIRYVTFETFSAEMVQALRTDSIISFKRKYREETDVLLFDDLPGLSTRSKTQEELLHVFNEILIRGGRVAFTTSVAPQRLENFIDPLKSRILSGVIAEIKSPTFQERVEILTRMSIQNHMGIEAPILHSMADQGQKDVRELIGSLFRVHLQAKLENRTLDDNYLAQAGWMREAQREAITMSEIVSLVEHNYGICRTELTSKSRKSVTSWARQVAMYLARTYTKLPLAEIGKTFERDHATVIHAFEKVKEAMEQQPHRRYEVEFLKQKLQARTPQSVDSPRMTLT